MLDLKVSTGIEGSLKVTITFPTTEEGYVTNKRRKVGDFFLAKFKELEIRDKNITLEYFETKIQLHAKCLVNCCLTKVDIYKMFLTCLYYNSTGKYVITFSCRPVNNIESPSLRSPFNYRSFTSCKTERLKMVAEIFRAYFKHLNILGVRNVRLLYNISWQKQFSAHKIIMPENIL